MNNYDEYIYPFVFIFITTFKYIYYIYTNVFIIFYIVCSVVQNFKLSKNSSSKLYTPYFILALLGHRFFISEILKHLILILSNSGIVN